MSALFGDAPTQYNGDFVSVADSGQAVGYDQCGSALAQFVQRVLNEHFRRVVERRGRFIEDEDGRIF